MSSNPYQPPDVPAASTAELEQRIARRNLPARRPAVSIGQTLGPRYWAAIIDNVCALVATYAAAKSISDRYPIVQAITFLSVYFLYFLVWEGLTGRTIGKLLSGLVVIQFDGRRITWRQALIRTLWRLVEVNPVFGAIPAGIAAWLSPHHQRLGDAFAGTVVVRSWRWRSFKKQLAAEE